MKVLVAVKRTLDYQTAVRLKADGSSVETNHTKMSMNPFDEIAVEEAVRLKEKGLVTEIITVSIGNEESQGTLRTALAMGADRGILIQTNLEIQPLAAAGIFKKIVEQHSVQLVILGKQAIDTDYNQTGQMLAGLLNWPQGTFASKLHFQEGGVSVVREVDGGLETLFLTLPAVITTDLRLNEPRYLSLPNIVQAKRKPMEIILAESLGIDLTPHIHTLKLSLSKKNRAGVRLESAEALVDILKRTQVIE